VSVGWRLTYGKFSKDSGTDKRTGTRYPTSDGIKTRTEPRGDIRTALVKELIYNIHHYCCCVKPVDRSIDRSNDGQVSETIARFHSELAIDGKLRDTSGFELVTSTADNFLHSHMLTS
jgi:hypothetical protein